MAIMSPTKDFDKDKYTLYNVVDVYSRHDTKIQEQLERVMTAKENTTQLPGIQGVASKSEGSAIQSIASDEDLQKLANWFNIKASGPCSGLGQYVVAKAKELGVSPYLAVIVPGIESTWGKHCANTNNFAGINSSNGFRSFDSPEACADMMLQSIASYRDDPAFGNIDITDINAVASKYCTPPDPWVSSARQLLNEASSATGVSVDLK